MNADDPRCGTVAGYVAHTTHRTARCEPCTTAARDYERGRHARRYLARGPLVIDGTGTRRRLQGLVAIGWTLAELDRRLGRERSFCYYLAGGKGDVLLTTATEIHGLYEDLCMTPAAGWLADRQRRIAIRNGWAAPLAWDNIDNPTERPSKGEAGGLDPVVVARLLAGQRIDSTRAEKEEAMRRWLANGGSQRELCRIHGWGENRYAPKKDAA